MLAIGQTNYNNDFGKAIQTRVTGCKSKHNSALKKATPTNSGEMGGFVILKVSCIIL